MIFVALGISFIPYAGIQNDEALFGGAVYTQPGIADQVSLGGAPIPLMLMSYLGALKAWIYTPIFQVWAPSPWSLRLPVLLAGAATLWIFAQLLRHTLGDRAAIIGWTLLASDTTYLLTTCFDWGPVALQHLLMVSGLLAIWRFYHTQRVLCLVLGCASFGLALWDKALAFWWLSGLTLATLAVFPTAVWRLIRNPRYVLIAIFSFCLGAWPLLRYNVTHSFETFRTNARFDAGDLPGKLHLLRSTLDGSGLFGYIARDDAEGRVREPAGTFERAVVRLSEATGKPRYGWFPEALAGALVLLGLCWRTPAFQAMLWAFIAALIAWVQMILNKDTGGSVHHVVLLWPLPHFFLAAGLAAGFQRFRWGSAAAGALTVTLAVSNLLVTNQHLAQLITLGPGKVWSDAIFPLSDSLRGVKLPIYVNDWGMLDTLHLLHRGKLDLRVGSDPLSKPQLDDADRNNMLERIASPAMFVAHSDGKEEFPGVNQHMREILQTAGYQRDHLVAIPDRNGREIFEVYSVAKSGR